MIHQTEPSLRRRSTRFFLPTLFTLPTALFLPTLFCAQAWATGSAIEMLPPTWVLNWPTLMIAVTVALIGFGVYRSKRSQLHRQQGIQQAILDAATDGIITATSEGIIIQVNHATSQLFGYPESELIGSPITRLMPAPVAQQHHQMMQNYPRPELKKQEISSIIGQERIVMAKRKDGSEFQVEIAISRFKMDREILFTGIIRDVTEGAMRQKLLLKQEQLLAAVLDATDQFVLIFDADCTLSMINDSALQSLGKSREEVLGKSITDIRSPQLPPLRKNRMLETLRLQQTLLDQEYIGGRWYELHYCPMHDSDRHVAIFAKDISTHKALEESLNHSKEQAIYANQAKSRFLSKLSHEFRTPLNSILGFTQVLLDDQACALNDAQTEAMELIHSSGKHLLNLVNDFLDIAKIEAGVLDIPVQETALLPIISDCYQTAKPIADKAGILMLLESAPSFPNALTNGMRLKQILLNILSNAIKYNRPQGSVTLRIAVQCDTVSFRVIDTGYGIAKDKQNALFNTFNRLGAEGSEVDGAGIGLALSKELAHAIHAHIGFSSTEGKGSEFWLDVPIAARSENVAPDTPYETQNPLTPSRPQRSGDPAKRILYVEDNPTNIKLIEAILEQYENHHLVSAISMEEGRKLALSYDFDLILMDLDLPDGSGVNLAKELRRSIDKATPAIVALTANVLPEQEHDRLFDAYLTKPIDVASFLKTIRQHLAVSA